MSPLIDLGSIYLSFLGWALLPGYAALRLVRPFDRPSARLAMAPGVSLALVALLAYGTDAVGLGATAPAVGVAMCVVLVALAVARRIEVGRWQWPQVREPWWMRVLPFVAPAAALVVMAPLRETVLPPTMHDGLDHATWFRLIYELGQVDRFVLMAPPFDANGDPTFYPRGFHVFAALVAKTAAADPITTFNHVVHLVAACIPLGVYPWVLRLRGRARVAALASGLTLLFYWLPFHPLSWGGFALLAGAACLLPAARLAIDGLTRPRVSALVLAGAVGFGVLLVHPSQAMGALLIAALTSAFFGRRYRRPALVLGGSLIALVVGVGVFASVWSPLAAFLAKAHGEAAAAPGAETWRWPFGLYAVRDSLMAFVLIVLAVVGAVAAASQARWRRLFLLHVALSAMLAVATLQLPLTAFWYHNGERLWYLQVASVPVLGALGVETVVRAAWRRLGVPRALTYAAALLGILAASVPYAGQVGERMGHWSRSFHAFRDHRALEHFAWIERNVPRDALLFNASADLGIVTAMTGRRAVFWSGGLATRREGQWQNWQGLMLRPSALTPQAHRALRDAGIRFVYAASYEPSVSAPDQVTISRSLLARHPGFEVLHESPAGSVLALTDGFRPEEVSRIQAWSQLVVTPFDHPQSVRVEGFHPPETAVLEDGTVTRWRWSTQVATLALEHFPVEDGCTLELSPPDPRPHTLQANGSEAARPAYPIPAGLDRPVELEIRSDTFVPEGPDDRTLGVALSRVFLVCRPEGELTRWSILPEVLPEGMSANERVEEVSGLHGLERLPTGRTFRWSDGRARFRIDTSGLPTPCSVHVAYVGDETGEIWIDGERAEPLGHFYILPPSVRWGRRLTLRVEAEEPFVPREVDGTSDDRELGVEVESFRFHCWPQ